MTVQPEHLDDELVIPVNSNADVEIWPTGDDDEFAVLSGFTQGRLIIRESLGSAALLTRSTGAGTLTIVTDTAGQHHVRLNGIGSSEWSSLPEGLYLADLVLGDAENDATFTERFWVKTIASITGGLS